MAASDADGGFDRRKIHLDFHDRVYFDGEAVAVTATGEVPYVNSELAYVVPFIKFDGDIPDGRASWHYNTHPIDSWMSLHILRLANDWTHSKVQEVVAKDRDLAGMLGFFENEKEGNYRLDPPSYTQIRDTWEETFSDRHRGACIVVAERFVEYVRGRGIPAPDTEFTPDQKVDVDEEDPDEDNPTVRELTTKKTEEMWKIAKPIVLNEWYLKRHHNWQIPEHLFADAQAHMATGDDLFPETGVGNLVTNGDYDDVHYPSTHRRELKKFTIDEIRDMYHGIVSEFVRRARRKNELVGNLLAGIDITYGHPWTGEIERDQDGTNIEPWIQGYRNDNDERTQYYFKWASIQIVGFDIPLVLDCIPVKRGRSRADIVDDLLDRALDIVPDLELVMMDAEFDSAGVKNACERHGVYYLNSKSRDATDKRRMRRMYGDGDDPELAAVHENHIRADMPMRREIYVPRVQQQDDDEGEEGDSYRDKLLEEFNEVDADDTERVGRESPLANLMEDIHEEEETDLDENGEHPAHSYYTVFETNHPDADPYGDDGEKMEGWDLVHVASRMLRKYSMRWGQENGFKKVKQFLPRSGSDDVVLRYFNFVWAATLYDCWRMVDLLVKLMVKTDPEYTPLVTAQRFREIAENHYGLAGLPPPDWGDAPTRPASA